MKNHSVGVVNVGLKYVQNALLKINGVCPMAQLGFVRTVNESIVWNKNEPYAREIYGSYSQIL